MQHGPTIFDVRAVLQKHYNSRATSNKMMHNATDSQHLKLEREDK